MRVLLIDTFPPVFSLSLSFLFVSLCRYVDRSTYPQLDAERQCGARSETYIVKTERAREGEKYTEGQGVRGGTVRVYIYTQK